MTMIRAVICATVNYAYIHNGVLESPIFILIIISIQITITVMKSIQPLQQFVQDYLQV